MYLAQRVVADGFGPWGNAIDKVQALKPRHIVAGHQNDKFDDDAERTIAETRQYLDDADELLRTENTTPITWTAVAAPWPWPPRWC
jgi:hypothetical protein